jgi:membrane protein required for colicin V production
MLNNWIWVDYVIAGIILLSALISLFRGFIREALSLVIWVLAFFVAWGFFRTVATHLDWIELPSARYGVAFFTLFVTTLVAGALVGFLIGQVLEKTGISGTDRLLGVIFGATRGALLVAVLVWLGGLTPLPNDPWWQQSPMIGYFGELAQWLRGLLPQDVAARFNYS